MPVDRYLHCSKQFGEAEFDLAERMVSVQVSDKEDISAIEINDLKLEPDGAVLLGYREGDRIVPVNSFPLVLDCSNTRYFVVEYGGEQVEWGLKVSLVTIEPTITLANAWTHKVNVEAMSDGGGSPYFQYRLSSAGSWTDCKDVVKDGLTVSAEISGLVPASEYVLRLVDGDDVSEEYVFGTEAAAQLPNMGFDSWYQTVKTWFPNESADNFIWDSANKGTEIVSVFPTTPTSDVYVSGDGKQAASLKSSTAFGLLAAGNMYTGKFKKLAGIGALIDWGVAFDSRPSGLKGYFKYSPAAINKSDEGHKYLIGKTDTCQVQILLTDWNAPFEINTSAGVFVDFDNDPGIIAYGKMETGETVAEYREFSIDLEYRDMTRKPKYIVITICASKYGDYFTGGVGSTMLVDEFELLYE